MYLLFLPNYFTVFPCEFRRILRRLLLWYFFVFGFLLNFFYQTTPAMRQQRSDPQSSSCWWMKLTWRILLKETMGENPRTTKSAQESFIVVARCMGGEGMKEEVKQKKKNSSIQFSRGSRDPRRSSPLPLSHSPLALLHGSFSHDHPSPSLSHSHQRPRRSTASSLQFLFFFSFLLSVLVFFFHSAQHFSFLLRFVVSVVR